MAPARTKKRVSDQSTTSRQQGAMADQKVAFRAASPSTPHQRSPIKKRKGGITLVQKQALIDNIQLEITERARRLRAQYNLQAQGLRSRIEIRVNRIPMSLRKVKMGDLLLKYMDGDDKRTTRQTAAVKDHAARSSPHKPARVASHTTKPAPRAQKRMSDAISGDKENEVEHIENAKKRVRAAQAAEGHVRPAQVLSPTSSNSRLANRARPASPAKSQIARPASPLKNSGTARSTAAATNMLSSMVEKAKATRAGATRKVTAASSTSSASNTTAAPKTKRAAAARAPPSRPATRNARRASSNSETSETSTGTVVKRTAPTKAAASTTKKGVIGSIRRGVAGATTKKTAAKTAAKTAMKTAAPTPVPTTGRVLRNRKG